MLDDPQLRLTLSVRLRQLRQEKGLSQADLSTLTEIPQPILSLYENPESRRMPSLVSLVLLANVYKASTDYLLGRTNEKNDNKGFVTEDDLLTQLSNKDRQVVVHVVKGLLAAARIKQEALKAKRVALKSVKDGDLPDLSNLL